MIEGVVMTKVEGEWVPVMHCTACLHEVGEGSLALWDAGSGRTVVTPMVVCGENCAAATRQSVPELTLDQTELSRFLFLIAVGTGTDDQVGRFMSLRAVGDAMLAMQTDDGTGGSR